MSAPPAPDGTASPSTPPNPDSSRKRARPTKSCLECRRKKLKCDRIQPCMQCKKLGRESLCTYANGPSGPPSAANEGSERDQKRPKFDVSKLNTWGGVVSANTQHSPSGTYSGQAGFVNGRTTTEQEPNVGEGGQSIASGQFRVKGGKSRYIGLGDWMALVDQFRDEKEFIANGFKNPTIAPILVEMAAFQRATHPKTKPPDRAFESRAALIAEMLNSLPENSTLDALSERYLVNLEAVLRVVHIPTFRKQSSEIQALRSSANMTLPPHIHESILAQLLSIISISARLSDSHNFKSTGQQLSEEQIATSHNLVQKWLDGLKGKEHLHIDTLRAQTLLLIARSVKQASSQALWKEAGTLVRTAMTMGFHRDPEASPDLSPFEKEQRRKLWQTIVELDLQFSLALGMPTAVQSLDYNSRMLLHVDDDQLVQDMSTYPEERPGGEWLEALPQILLGSVMRPRLDAANILARDIVFPRDAHKILLLAKDLENGLRSLQSTLPNHLKKQQRLFSNIMLDVHLRRPALALYQIVALSEQASRYPEARKGALRCSVAILSHLDALDPAVADLDTIKSKDYLNFFHIIYKNDILQSALLLCYEIRAFNKPSVNSPLDPALTENTTDDSIPWTKHSLTRIVENTLNSLLQRLGEFGSCLKVILPLSIVLQSVRSDGTPEGKRELMMKGAERVLQTCRKVLPPPAAQEKIHPNGNTSGMQMPQTPLSNMSTGENWNAQGSESQYPYQSGLFHPIANNTEFNPVVNGVGAFPNFDMSFSDFSDWDMMGQTWF